MVKCKDCGLMALKSTTTVEFLEADEEYRTNGLGYNYLRDPAQSGPVCIAKMFNLRGELLAIVQEPEPSRTLTVICLERACPSFTPWKPGFSPKEHVEMIQLQQMREWQEKSDREAAEREATRRRVDRRWSIGQAIAIAVLTAILGLLLEPWKERAKQSVQPAPAIETIPSR